VRSIRGIPVFAGTRQFPWYFFAVVVNSPGFQDAGFFVNIAMYSLRLFRNYHLLPGKDANFDVVCNKQLPVNVKAGIFKYF
jgi:hypothetical protein